MSALSLLNAVMDEQIDPRVELHRLVDKLDAEEAKIATAYVANLLLAGAKANESRSRR